MFLEIAIAAGFLAAPVVGLVRAIGSGIGRSQVQQTPERSEFHWESKPWEWRRLLVEQGPCEALDTLEPVALGTLVPKRGLYRRRYGFCHIPSGGYAVADLDAVGVCCIADL